jgi:glycosyltransferase involved in cell wall biosynthesis
MDKDINTIQVPLVSIIMPVFNAGHYIEEAISSVLNQSLTNFELLIYDDASTDHTYSIIRTFSDERIIYEKMPENVGYVFLRNMGIANARGKYIAWMDADDVSMPTRFEEQVYFMESHPFIGICGTWYEFFGDKSGIVECPVSFDEIKYSLFFGTPFGNPSVMMKKELIDKHGLRYDDECYATEDYDMFERASFCFELANIPKVLLKYRKHDTQVTNTSWQQQYFVVGLIQARRFLRSLNGSTAADKEWLEKYLTSSSITTKEWQVEIQNYKNRIIDENNKRLIYSPEILKRAVNNIFTEEATRKNIYNFLFKKYYSQQKYSIRLLGAFLHDRLRPYSYLGKKLTLLFAIKCLFGYTKEK